MLILEIVIWKTPAGRAGTAYYLGALEFTLGVQWGSCCSLHILCSVLLRKSLFALSSFLLWPLHCLFVLDLLLLIPSLVSSTVLLTETIAHMQTCLSTLTHYHQSLLFLLYAAYFAEKQQIPIRLGFDTTVIELMISNTRRQTSNHYMTEVGQIHNDNIVK